MTHVPRLMQSLRALLQRQRVAALGSLCDDGTPLVSMVPYAIASDPPCVMLHVSALAQHTRNLQATPAVSLLVMQSEVEGEPVHSLPRVSLQGQARTLTPEDAAWERCRAAYLERFPDAEPMTLLGDFRFVAIDISGARQVAGFGSARTVGLEELQLILATQQDRASG